MWTYRFASFTVLVTLLLLLVGGIVHGTGSSLACPDWPRCFGSFFPEMKGNVLIEHGHRLLASFVGCLTLLLAVLTWRMRAERPGLAKLGVLAVVLVCFQGVLGGITVLYRLPTLVSSAHLSTSMLFIALLTVIAALLRPDLTRRGISRGGYALLVITMVLVYLQISLGGLVRHSGAGLACPDLPLCRGQLLPLDAHSTVILMALHRLLGVLAAAFLLAVALLLRRDGIRRGSAPPLTAALPLILALLVLIQIGLGVMSSLSFLGLFYVTAHLGVAALLVICLSVLVIVLRPKGEALA